MTLRLIVEIIPNGIEEDKYEIGVIEAMRIGLTGLGRHRYLLHYIVDGRGEKEDEVEHNRQDGVFVLIKKAIERLKL